MRAPVTIDLLLITPLALAVFATAPWLAPVRRAFGLRGDRVRLAPGEVVVAVLRPDPGVLACTGLLTVAGLAALSLTLRALLPGAVLLGLAVGGGGAFAWLWTEARNRWLLTDRRLIAASGAVMALSGVRRIRVAPGLIAVQGPGAQGMHLVGIAAGRDLARLIQSVAAPRAPP
jgi:hypothetical protein